MLESELSVKVLPLEGETECPLPVKQLSLSWLAEESVEESEFCS